MVGTQEAVPSAVLRSMPPEVEMVDSATAKSLLDTLRLRPVRDDELEKLVQFRIECGWGEERLRKSWLDPDWPLFVVTGKNSAGKEEEVGMGGLILDGYDGLASREKGWIVLSNLFVRYRYRGSGLGMRAFELLEKMAVNEYQAKALTLDTAAYKLTPAPDKTHELEEIGTPSGNRMMYKRRGYEDFSVSGLALAKRTWETAAEEQEPKRSYPNGPGEDLYAIKMKKEIRARSANGNQTLA